MSDIHLQLESEVNVLAKSTRPKYGDEAFPLWKHPSGRWCKKVRGNLMMRRTPGAGREFDAKYFSNTLLVKFITQNPELTAHWKIAARPRGPLHLPSHAGLQRIPCGTADIDVYLAVHNPVAEAVGETAAVAPPRRRQRRRDIETQPAGFGSA